MFDKMKKVLTSALKEAGATEYEIYYMSGAESSVATLNRQVNSSTLTKNGGLCLRVLKDGKMGYASTELLTEQEMIELVDRAISNAAAVEKLDTVGIYGGSESYEENRLAKFEPMTAGELRAAALATAEAIYSADGRITDGTMTQAASSSSEVRIVNSHGLDLSCSAGVNVIVGEAVVDIEGEKESDFSFKALDKNNTGKAIAELVKDATEGALSKIGADVVPSGKYNIVLDGKMMNSFMSVFSSAFSAKQVLDGMSPLKDKVGEKIASEIITVIDDPQREGSTVGTPFDAEGVATHRKAVVENGVLKTYLHNRETALAMNTETTANASKGDYASPIGIRPYFFSIEPGKDTADELLAKAKDGIYITEVKGLHAGANTVTGDFSLESAGFMIRDGKRAEAVKSFTVAGNFFELLSSITAVADEVKSGVQMGLTAFGSPDVLIPDMSVAGK